MNGQYYIQKILFSKLKDLGGSAEVFISGNGVENKESIDSVDETNLTVKFKSNNTVKFDNGTLTYTQNGNPITITVNDIRMGSLNIGLSNVKGSFMGVAFGGRKSKRRSRRPKRKRSRRYKIK
jgi:hypothetical protein